MLQSAFVIAFFHLFFVFCSSKERIELNFPSFLPSFLFDPLLPEGNSDSHHIII